MHPATTGGSFDQCKLQQRRATGPIPFTFVVSDIVESNTIHSTMFRGVIDMTVTVATSGSVLLCLFAAKRFI
jgi:hypothetical protein